MVGVVASAENQSGAGHQHDRVLRNMCSLYPDRIHGNCAPQRLETQTNVECLVRSVRRSSNFSNILPIGNWLGRLALIHTIGGAIPSPTTKLKFNRMGRIAQVCIALRSLTVSALAIAAGVDARHLLHLR